MYRGQRPSQDNMKFPPRKIAVYAEVETREEKFCTWHLLRRLYDRSSAFSLRYLTFPSLGPHRRPAGSLRSYFAHTSEVTSPCKISCAPPSSSSAATAASALIRHALSTASFNLHIFLHILRVTPE